MTVQTSDSARVHSQSSRSSKGRRKDLQRLFRDNQVILLKGLGIGPRHAQELMEVGMVCTAVSAVCWSCEIVGMGTEVQQKSYELFKGLSTRDSAHLDIWNTLRELGYPVDSPHAAWLTTSPNHALAFVKQLNALLYFDGREERF